MVIGWRPDFPREWLAYAAQHGWHFLTFSYQLLLPGNAATLISDVKDLGNWIASSLNACLAPHNCSVDLSRIIASGQICRRIHLAPVRSTLPPALRATGDQNQQILDIPFSTITYPHPRISYYEYLIATGTYAEKFGFEDGPVIPHMDASFPKTAIVHRTKDTITPIEEAKSVLEQLTGNLPPSSTSEVKDPRPLLFPSFGRSDFPPPPGWLAYAGTKDTIPSIEEARAVFDRSSG
ncbi:hypothetical protein BJ742DRAFT_873553 [Cladochytrium replicatum]|nr:hypothetical protein BJ742DRAFT_873553 [Cladochytrium replicatum]